MTRLSAALLGLLLATGTAGAQEMYESSIPAPGQVFKDLPEKMQITFLTSIHLTDLRLTDAAGTEWPLEWAKTEENVFDVQFRLAKPLAPGKYILEWKAYIRQHYHDDGGTISFTYTPAR
jgi:methionine-rich copper-binding protein CopC